MDNTDSCIPLSEIHIQSPFDNLFPKRQHVLDALKAHIQDHGFDDAFPLILAYGPWTDHDLLLDGHCRKNVCEQLGLEEVPVVRRYFETEDAALEYAIHVQKDRRNLTDAEIVTCVATLDARKDPYFHGNQHVPGLAQRCATPPSGKSAEKTAEVLGISVRKVEQVRTVLAHAGEEMKQAIRSGDKSINKAYKEIQVQRKEKEENLNGAVMDTSAPVADEVSLSTPRDTPEVETPEPDDAHAQAATRSTDPAVDELGVLVDASRAANGWVHTIITGFDIGSIDYIIIGQGTPPVTINENQQVFLAPWMAQSQGDPLDPTEDAANQAPPTPPKQQSPVNLCNYDAAGWYALEQAWAKPVPGVVPEPPEGIEGTKVTEETTIETDPSHGASVTPPTTDAKNLAPTAETATEPALDPRIVQILDLKATEDGNIIVKFLRHLGLCRTNSFGTVRIDRDRLLAYLVERDANSVQGFSRLLEEFRASPQIEFPSDEDLQIDLHNDFFHYPYGERWFWEQCPTKDDSGLSLREGGFGANVLAFMTEHGLKSLDDIVTKVAQMHEELRPKRSVP